MDWEAPWGREVNWAFIQLKPPPRDENYTLVVSPRGESSINGAEINKRPSATNSVHDGIEGLCEEFEKRR
jgi:hypothetical protein